MKKSLHTKMHGLVLLILGAISSFAGPYDTGAWTKFKLITVNTATAGVTGTVTNFPLLIRLTNTDAAHGSDVLATASPIGADLRFTDATGGITLPYQIDFWTGSEAVIWVLVPDISGNASTTIRMYWGNGTAIGQSNGGAVFDTANGFRSVWHLGDGSGTSPRPNAVTPYSMLPATLVNFADDYNPVPGVIGMMDTLPGGDGGLTDAGTPYIKILGGTDPATNAYNFPGGKFTASFWAKSIRFNANRRHFDLYQGTAANNAIQSIPSTQADPATMYFRFSAGSVYQGGNAGGAVLALNTWQHIACVVSRGADGTDTLIKYVNGVEYDRVVTSSQLPETPRDNFYLGRTFENVADSTFAGSLDEMEFANATRSPAWIKLSYATQVPGQTTVTFGATATPVGILGSSTPRPGIGIHRVGSSVSFHFPSMSGAEVSVMNMRGRTVWSQSVGAGTSELTWNGMTSAGRSASAGLYMVRMKLHGTDARAPVVGTKFIYTP